jgi:molybdate transport system substrate-binding protein
VAVLATVPAGCTPASDEEQLTVLAAASLAESFDALAEVFEEQHAGVRVVASYDASSTLATQAAQGAPGDVLATADTATMQAAVDADAVEGEPVVFASNTLRLVVPAGNPAGIRDLGDLARPGVGYVMCAESVPCGELAGRLLEGEGIEVRPRSFEVDVKAVLTKVVLDEADAGLVYATDARAAGEDVETIDVPAAGDAATRYPVAVLAQSDQSDLAREWVDLLTSEQGQQVLAEAGFGSPS